MLILKDVTVLFVTKYINNEQGYGVITYIAIAVVCKLLYAFYQFVQLNTINGIYGSNFVGTTTWKRGLCIGIMQR
jgi:uncharacterized membrane-anchored protein